MATLLCWRQELRSRRAAAGRRPLIVYVPIVPRPPRGVSFGRAAPLFLYRVPHCIVDPTDRVLNFSGGFFILTLDLKLGAALALPTASVTTPLACPTDPLMRSLSVASNLCFWGHAAG